MKKHLNRVVLVACIMLLSGSMMSVVPRSVAQTEELDGEIEVALEGALSKIKKLEAELEKQRSIQEVLSESLAAANVEAKKYRDLYEKLRLQIEALGVEVIQEDSPAIQRRLIKAVSDLSFAEREKEALVGQLLELSEAAMYAKRNPDDKKAQEQLEKILKDTEQFYDLGLPSQPRAPRNLAEAEVVNVKPEYNLIVLNVGEKSGVRLGMPVKIVRKDRPVGSALVVDVRDDIAGAVVSELIVKNDAVEVGDRIKVDIRKF